MNRVLPYLMLAGLLALAPAALAEENATAPDEEGEQAWVDDCPPDMMCAYEEDPQRYGPDDCIDCTQAPPQEGTCMDGADAGERCDEDVQYVGGPSRGPQDGSCEDCRGEDLQTESSDAKTVPGIALAGVLGTLGLTVLLVRRATR